MQKKKTVSKMIQLVSESPSVLAGEKEELNNTSDAGPFNTVTISTVASRGYMHSILVQ